MVSLFDAVGLGQWFRLRDGASLRLHRGSRCWYLGCSFRSVAADSHDARCDCYERVRCPCLSGDALLLLLAAAAVAWARRHQLESSDQHICFFRKDCSYDR